MESYCSFYVCLNGFTSNYTHKNSSNPPPFGGPLTMIDFCGAGAITLPTIVKVFETDMCGF